MNLEDISEETIEYCPELSSETTSNSFLGETFLEDNALTCSSFVFDTPTHADLHAPCHSTFNKPDSDFLTEKDKIPILSFQPEHSISDFKSTKMERLAKCQEFHGYPQDNANKFLAEFESFATLHDLSDFSDRKLAAFHLHLRGPALTWYNSLSEESRNSWQSVRVLFREKYINFSAHGASVLMHSEIFQNLTLLPGQSIEDFFCQIVEKGQLLRKPEHELLTKFKSGLPEQMSFFVRAGQPQALQSALTSAKMAEACGYRKHNDSINAITAKPKHKQFDDKPSNHAQNPEIVDLKEQIRRLNDLVAVKQSERATVPQQQTSEKSEIAGLKDQIKSLTELVTNLHLTPNRDRRSNPPGNFVRKGNWQGECYKCKGQGHVQRDCNWNGNGTTPQKVKCQLCGQSGHAANNCATLAATQSGNKNIPEDGHGRPG